MKPSFIMNIMVILLIIMALIAGLINKYTKEQQFQKAKMILELLMVMFLSFYPLCVGVAFGLNFSNI